MILIGTRTTSQATGDAGILWRYDSLTFEDCSPVLGTNDSTVVPSVLSPKRDCGPKRVKKGGRKGRRSVINGMEKKKRKKKSQCVRVWSLRLLLYWYSCCRLVYRILWLCVHGYLNGYSYTSHSITCILRVPTEVLLTSGAQQPYSHSNGSGTAANIPSMV